MSDTAAAAVDPPAPAGSTARWLGIAALLAAVCGALTFAVRSTDGFDAEAELLAESGNRVSETNRALAAVEALRDRPEFTDPPDGVDEIEAGVPFGSGLIELRVRADTEAAAGAHAGTLIELVLAASRDEEVRILESQIAELEVTLEGLDPASREAERALGDIEVRRGQLAVLTGLIQPVGEMEVNEVDDQPLRDAVVVAVVVLLGVGVIVPRALGPER
ncbi:MAG: hypothetical protein AAGA99_10210 [Actinomycetota bacterium]